MKNVSVVAMLLVFGAGILGHNERSDSWPEATPESVGIAPYALQMLDKEIRSGRFPLVDSMLVIRCGRVVYNKTYSHPYSAIYNKEAHEKGPLNAHLTGVYNYFDPQFHPYFQGTNAHTMQSVTKTITSVVYGIAMQRSEFHANLDTPILKFFDSSKIENLDDRKRKITLGDLLTMRAGFDWNEDLPYNDPRNGSSVMEATDDWIKFVIDRPMAYEPGTHFTYSSGVAELLGYIFQKATGQDIEKYATKYLFAPLGFEHVHWKRTPLGLPDTEGGLYLRPVDLAKIGKLYLQDGVWNGRRIVSAEWVKQSVSPATDARGGMKYGFQWWLIPYGENKLAWAALGFGGQQLLVLPKDDLIMVFTGWSILKDSMNSRDAISEILTGLSPVTCKDVS